MRQPRPDRHDRSRNSPTVDGLSLTNQPISKHLAEAMQLTRAHTTWPLSSSPLRPSPTRLAPSSHGNRQRHSHGRQSDTSTNSGEDRPDSLLRRLGKGYRACNARLQLQSCCHCSYMQRWHFMRITLSIYIASSVFGPRLPFGRVPR